MNKCIFVKLGDELIPPGSLRNMSLFISDPLGISGYPFARGGDIIGEYAGCGIIAGLFDGQDRSGL